MPARLFALALVMISGVITGCGSTPQQDPHTLLTDAQQVLNTTDSVHFAITSENVPSTGTALTGADGDAKKPDSFSGTLKVSLNGFAADVKIVSVAGNFFVRTPFSTTFETAHPSDYGFGDPAQLLNTDHGVVTLLSLATGVQSAGQSRYQGEELDKVTANVPGDRVAALLTSADPSQPVSATFEINATSHQLRRVTVTGPFIVAIQMSTYTVVLDQYGETVKITPPS